jgi:shikimate dehydrogenase
MGIPYAEVIGDPISHSKSPLIHNFWLQTLGIEGEFRQCLVRPDELGAYFEARARDGDWRGCSVTMPHKVAALRHVHKHQDPSFPIEPVNLVIPRKGRLEGLNSDGQGLMEPLLAQNIGRLGGTSGAAIVVGSGGVLYSVMGVLSALGFAPIWVVTRDPDKAMQISNDYKGVCGRPISFEDPLPEARLLVNATPLGMTGFPDFPLGLESLTPDASVFDLVYNPLDTSLLKAARGRGLRTIDGLAMLIGQAAISFQGFFGAPAPRAQDAELRERLTS